MKVSECASDVVYLSTLVKLLLSFIDNPHGIDLDKVETVRDSYLDWQEASSQIAPYTTCAKNVHNHQRLQELQIKLYALTAIPPISPDSLYVEEDCEDV